MPEVGVEIRIGASKATEAISIAGQEIKGFGDAFKKYTDSVKASNEEVKKSNEKTGDSFKGVKDEITALVSVAAIEEFFRKAISAALASEEAYRTLKGSIEAAGGSWQKVSKDVKEFAEAQESATRFSETETVETMSRLSRVTNDVGQAMTATALAQNIASASGRSLEETTSIVSNLLAGQQRGVMMARKEFAAYVGDTNDATTALGRLQKAFSGAAVDEDSHTKSLKESANAIENTMKVIGQGLLPVLDAFAHVVAMIVKGWHELGIAIGAVMAEVVTVISTQLDITTAIFKGHFREAGAIAREGWEKVKDIASEAGKEIDAVDEQFHSKKKSRINELSHLQAKVNEQAIKEQEKLSQEYLKAVHDDYDAGVAAINQSIREAERAGVAKFTIQQGNTKREVTLEEFKNAQLKKLGELRLHQASDILGNLATLSQSKNSEVAAIGKAAAVAQATVQTYLSATEAYASMAAIPVIGPALGTAAAAAAIAAGLMNVAKIEGVQLAEGGIARARPGGIQATIAEGGKDEVVAPLDRLRELMGGAGGGGATYIFNNTYMLPGIDALRDPRVIDEILESFAERLAQRSPAAVSFSRRSSDLARLNSGRAA